MSERFAGFRRPNSTDTPDEFYLVVAPQINHLSEMKVILYIIRKTFGWRKWEDWISLPQFERGQGGADRGCGLSRPAIIDGLKRALEHGYIVRRFLCPHCGSEVHKTETQHRPWKNRHAAGYKDVPAVPLLCPHCSQPLRGQERPFYRLAFAHDVIHAYDTPQDFLAKYTHHQAKNPSTQLENPSSKLDNSTSPSPMVPSTIPSTTSAASQESAAGAGVVSPCPFSQNSPQPASDPGESETDPQTGGAGNGVAANLRAMAEYGVQQTQDALAVAMRPGMTPSLIHAWGQHVWARPDVDNKPAYLVTLLRTATQPPNERNNAYGHRPGVNRRRRRGEYPSYTVSRRDALWAQYKDRFFALVDQGLGSYRGNADIAQALGLTTEEVYILHDAYSAWLSLQETPLDISTLEEDV